MTFGQWQELHPFEQQALMVFANAYENDRREFMQDLANNFLKSLSG